MAKRRARKALRRVGGAARRVGRYVGGFKGTGLELGGGVAAYYGVRALSSNFETLNKYWYGPPVAAAVVGHIIKKKAPKYAQFASAGIGAAGVIGAMAYESNKQAEQQGGTEGFDTGILLQPSAAGSTPMFESNFALDAFNPPQMQQSQPVVQDTAPAPVTSVSEAASLGR